MLKWVLLMLVAGIGPGNAQRASCDLIEINHAIVEGKVIYCQVIYWRWHDDLGEHHVANWRLLEGDQSIRKIGDRYVDLHAPLEISAPAFRETWSADPERLDKKVLPVQLRKKLWDDGDRGEN